MTTKVDLDAIRNLTRLSLPESDAYIFRLGVALYGFASLCSFMAEITSYLDPDIDRSKLQSKTGGAILKAFRQGVNLDKAEHHEIGGLGDRAAEKFEQLNGERSDIIHAYPITGTSGEQILHRRQDRYRKYFEVTDDFLDNFISRLTEVDDLLYDIRKIVYPAAGD